MTAHNRHTPHAETVVHQNAVNLIDYLMGQNGKSMDASIDIAGAMGITMSALHGARLHTLECNGLGGYVVAYRRRGRFIVLFEATAASVVTALTDRTDPSFDGFRRLYEAYTSAQRRQVAIIDTAAREARSSGNTDLADALDYASQDIARFGELQPVTEAWLRRLGAVA